MNELALFAGAGGGILAGHLLGWHTVCAVECEPYAASVLAARQNDGLLPPFPIWDDVRTFDGRPWRGVVDVVSGGFPCQDISVAGKGAGIDGDRSGLWSHMARIIGEVRPRFALVENSPALITRGLGRVLGDLAALGYDCRWTVLGAADVGAPHRRDRFWLVAHSNANGRGRKVERQQEHGEQQGSLRGESDGLCACRSGEGAGSDSPHANSDQLRQLPRRKRGPGGAAESTEPADDGQNRDVADSTAKRCAKPWSDIVQARGAVSECDGEDVPNTTFSRPQERQCKRRHACEELAAIERDDWWVVEPDVGRVADGVAARVDRLKALGNGQVPRCAAAAWRMLTADL